LSWLKVVVWARTRTVGPDLARLRVATTSASAPVTTGTQSSRLSGSAMTAASRYCCRLNGGSMVAQWGAVFRQPFGVRRRRPLTVVPAHMRGLLFLNIAARFDRLAYCRPVRPARLHPALARAGLLWRGRHMPKQTPCASDGARSIARAVEISPYGPHRRDLTAGRP
jgi:hypothetical protein